MQPIVTQCRGDPGDIAAGVEGDGGNFMLGGNGGLIYKIKKLDFFIRPISNLGS